MGDKSGCHLARDGEPTFLAYVSRTAASPGRGPESPGERILRWAAPTRALVGDPAGLPVEGGSWTVVAAVPAGVTRASVGGADGRTIIMRRHSEARSTFRQSVERPGIYRRLHREPIPGDCYLRRERPRCVCWSPGHQARRRRGEHLNGISKTTDGGRTGTSEPDSRGPLEQLIMGRAQERITGAGSP